MDDIYILDKESILGCLALTLIKFGIADLVIYYLKLLMKIIKIPIYINIKIKKVYRY